MVYFTRSPEPPASPSIVATRGSSHISTPRSASPSVEDPPKFYSSTPPVVCRTHGALTPLVLEQPPNVGIGLLGLTDGLLRNSILKRTVQHFPGGSLNFERFETDSIDECVTFIQELIERSAQLNGVSIEEMRKGVKIMATGGGAHKFYELFQGRLHVDVQREDEMECLIEGLKFITLIPDEVYYFSDELISSVAHQPPSTNADIPRVSITLPTLVSESKSTPLERPSPNPPTYAVTFETNPTPQLPCLLVNIGSGVSIIKVDVDGGFERVSGTSLGGGTLWGLLSLLTSANTFDGGLFPSDIGHKTNSTLSCGNRNAGAL